MNDCYIYNDNETLEEQIRIVKQLIEDEQVYIFLRNGERIDVYNYKNLKVDIIVYNNIEFITFFSNDIFDIEIIGTKCSQFNQTEKYSIYNLYIPCRLIKEIS